MNRLQSLVEQIVMVRNYSQRLIDSVPMQDWFRQPTEGVTHIAWQVGHLSFAEFRLTQQRIRGDRPGDTEILPEVFWKKFGKDSVPGPNPADYPEPKAILAVFNRVHQQALAELSMLDESELDQETAMPHPLFKTKGGSLAWCAQHEMMHAGQIGLLRRLLGAAPLW